MVVGTQLTAAICTITATLWRIAKGHRVVDGLQWQIAFD
jgi:hypothetical protein